MLINLRDKDGKLIIKDILDIDFDMKVKQYGEHYGILINKRYD